MQLPQWLEVSTRYETSPPPHQKQPRLLALRCVAIARSLSLLPLHLYDTCRYLAQHLLEEKGGSVQGRPAALQSQQRTKTQQHQSTTRGGAAAAMNGHPLPLLPNSPHPPHRRLAPSRSKNFTAKTTMNLPRSGRSFSRNCTSKKLQNGWRQCLQIQATQGKRKSML